MKIRIKGNSVRYRLTKTDIEHFAKDGYIQETTAFGSNNFTYALKHYDIDILSASFENNTITLFMSEQMALELAQTERVGFESTSDKLRLLIEKDFMCMDITTEDQSDNYPNPLLTSK